MEGGLMRLARRTLGGVAGIAATVLLHSLFFAAAMWSGGRLLLNPRAPDAVGAGANSGERDAEPGERRIEVMLSTSIDIPAPPIEPPPQLLEPVMEQPSIVAITGINALPLPPIEIPGEAAEDLDAQMMARAKFAGMYESQVRARIMRAWELPAEAVSGADFSCLVQIRQQQDGRVKEVSLVLAQCEGSPAWQQSLVDAIQVASPLPAPPHPSAFIDTFALVFHAHTAKSVVNSPIP
jgi:hypothetical protein